MKHAKGAFQGVDTLEWWVKTDGGRPALSVNLGGGSVSACPPRQGGPACAQALWRRRSCRRSACRAC